MWKMWKRPGNKGFRAFFHTGNSVQFVDKVENFVKNPYLSCILCNLTVKQKRQPGQLKILRKMA